MGHSLKLSTLTPQELISTGVYIGHEEELNSLVLIQCNLYNSKESNSSYDKN